MPGPVVGRAAQVLHDVAEANRRAHDEELDDFMDSGDRREGVPIELWRALR